MIAATLRILADLADQYPADMVSAHEGGVTIVVSNEFTAARWITQLDRHPGINADVRMIQRIGDVA